jgi:hypothetical protein
MLMYQIYQLRILITRKSLISDRDGFALTVHIVMLKKVHQMYVRYVARPVAIQNMLMNTQLKLMIRLITQMLLKLIMTWRMKLQSLKLADI